MCFPANATLIKSLAWSLLIFDPMVMFAQDITELRKTVEETNRTQALQRSLTQEQIHGLVSTTTDLSQRVSSLERGGQAPVQGVSQGPKLTFLNWSWKGLDCCGML